MDTLFATETMAELSARQGRVAEAVAIYRHLLRASTAAPDDDARVARWKLRLDELERDGAGVSAPSPPGALAEDAGSPARRERAEPPPPASAPRTSLVVREPVRSGQVIYAQACDLIVVAPVHSGAQLLADGNIHVYGCLGGRAVAGAHGARDAQVFCLALEAELVGIDSGYVVSDDIPADLWGGPARVHLTAQGTCAVAALAVGKRGAPATTNIARRIS